MQSTTQPNTILAGTAGTASALRKLYFTRAAFSIVWVTLVSTVAKTNAAAATVLFIIYPAWDAVATFFDINANPPSANKTPQYVNVGISILTTIAVIIALQKGIPEALIVFGVWAFGTGLIQLFLGLRRRKQFGGQWPMILSGGQSMAAGIIFIITSHMPNQGLSTLGGYSAVGAIYFLLSAIWLGKAIRKLQTARA